MNKAWHDSLNGYGVLFRFITPIMVGIIGWFTVSLIVDIKQEIGEIKIDAKNVAVGMTNHLEHHRILEINLAERLTAIEVLMRKTR